MDSSNVRPARLRVAIVLSIVLHVCALLILALLGGKAAGSISSIDDRTLVYTSLTIVRRGIAPTRPALKRAPLRKHVAARIAPRAARVAQARWTVEAHDTAPLVQNSHGVARNLMETKGSSGSALSRRLAPRANRSSSTVDRGKLENPIRIALGAHPQQHAAPPARLIVLAPPAPTPLPIQAPTPSPTPTPPGGGTPRAAASGGFSGLFSQNYPPALTTPTIVDTIRTRLGSHGRIRIDINESGHAIDIHFTDTVSPAAAQDVRAQLLAVLYVPADCNGLHCDGTLEISY